MSALIETLNPLYAERLARRQQSDCQGCWNVLDEVCDPELPGVSLWDLGVLQDIRRTENLIQVDITLTYSGCPAVHTMMEDIKACLNQHYPDYHVEIEVVLSPAWSTDLMSPEARRQLHDIHIAPPADNEQHICCPLCDSDDTRLISQFGSTSCKALYQCNSCAETFDYFKSF